LSLIKKYIKNKIHKKRGKKEDERIYIEGITNS